ncbi:MAG: type II secretion system protein GspG, partial [Kiritimatiellae bacterium]|nr:type II secretion system protein GspG [Kiritimatiellia bacterium]
MPEDENGFELLLAALDILDMQSSTIFDFKNWIESPLAHQEEVLKALEANRPLFKVLEQALSKGRLQSPPIDFSDSHVPWVSPALAASTLLRLAAQDAENPLEAQKYVGLALALGDQLLQYADYMVAVAVGAACRTEANHAVLHLARDPKTQTEYLWQILSMLTENTTPWTPWKNALRTEYQFLKYALAYIHKNQKYYFFNENGNSYATIPFAFQPNNTRRAGLEAYQNPMLSLKTGNLQALINSDRFISELDNEIRSKPVWDPRRYFNRTGKRLLLELYPSYDGFAIQAFRHQAENRATILVTALQLYQREQGEFPQTLQDLVPAYLAAIPADPFDGHPFRYDRDKAIVYAIGENLVDNGGSTKMRGSPRTPSRSGAEDFVFGILAPIDFTAGD